MGDTVSMKVVGLTELSAKLRSMGGLRIRNSAKKSLYQFAEMIMTDAKQNYVPVEENVLRSSGMVLPPEESGTEVIVTMAFGGAASAYALAVHEHLSVHSPKSWKIAGAKGVKFRVGGPKYLELPFLSQTSGGKLEAKIAADLEIEWARA